MAMNAFAPAETRESAVSPSARPSLTVVILTHNEALHIERALHSIKGLAQRVLVVDSGSTDVTRELAQALGADVRTRTWVNYADQFQWALDECGIATDWIMRLDADEIVGPELVARLAAMLPSLPATTTAISLDRRHYFLGRWIRHGGRYPLRLTRIWRRGVAHIEQRWMDEHVVVASGETHHVDGEFSDINLNDITFFTAKHNGYATREAIDALIGKYGLFESDGNEETRGLTAQARAKRKAKTGFYNRLPLGVGPLAYFLYRYILQGGFLDGKPGLIYHGLQGLWYRFLVDARRHELELGLAGLASNDERIDAISRMTGHDLRAFAAASVRTVTADPARREPAFS